MGYSGEGPNRIAFIQTITAAATILPTSIGPPRTYHQSDLHAQISHLPYNADCAACVETRGRARLYIRNTDEEARLGATALDIAHLDQGTLCLVGVTKSTKTKHIRSNSHRKQNLRGHDGCDRKNDHIHRIQLADRTYRQGPSRPRVGRCCNELKNRAQFHSVGQNIGC